MSRSEDLGSLESYVRQLRYAVATTTCRETVAVLKQMLHEAEARVLSNAQKLPATCSKRL